MNNEHVIYAYAFDKLNIQNFSKKEICENGLIIKFIDFNSFEPLNNANGVIIPQGIFETFSSHKMFNGFINVEVSISKNMLLKRAHEIYNLIESGGWVCFLVSEIIDEVGSERYRKNVYNTDLCKQILNTIGVNERKNIDGVPYLSSKTDEFRAFVKQYGIGKTIFKLSNKKDDFNILITSRTSVFGFEAYLKLFFLPVQIVNFNVKDVINLVKIISLAINDYRQKREIAYPKWFSELSFKEEEELKNKLNELAEEELQINRKLEKYSKYKAILTTSGELLRKIIIDIFVDFFNFNIDSKDKFKEDFKILGKDTNPIVFCEVKGTKKGIKREHINQVDSHRERSGYGINKKGILIINNEMAISGCKERFDTSITEEQVKHARKMNVLIIRTIDLINYLILQQDNINRSDQFLDILKNNVGWLKVSETGIETIN